MNNTTGTLEFHGEFVIEKDTVVFEGTAEFAYNDETTTLDEVAKQIAEEVKEAIIESYLLNIASLNRIKHTGGSLKNGATYKATIEKFKIVH